MLNNICVSTIESIEKQFLPNLLKISVPGDGASRIEAKHDETPAANHEKCHKYTSSFINIWLGPTKIFFLDCLVTTKTLNFFTRLTRVTISCFLRLTI